MSSVCIIDTSIFLNLLNVSGRNQQRESVNSDFIEYVNLGATFILPMATIIETGNHIAQNGNGVERRESALRFCEAVRGAFEDRAPYRLSEFPASTDILEWLDKFPDCAGRNKSPKKTGEGTSFGALSIIEEYRRCVKLFRSREIFIWSLDDDLRHYRHP